MSRILPLLTVLVVLISCSTHTAKDDTYYPDKLFPSANQEWVNQYLEAQKNLEKNPTQSCDTFLRLAKNGSFPLREVASIKTHLACLDLPQDKDLGALDYDKYNNTWLEDLVLEIRLKEARAHKNNDQLIEALAGKARLSASQSEKISLLKEAINLTQLENKTDKMTELTQKLYKIAPRLNPVQTREELLKIAHDYRQAREFKKSRQIYESVYRNKKSSQEDKFLALKGLRQTYKIEQDKEADIKATQRLAKFSQNLLKKDPSATQIERVYEAQNLLIRALWTEGQNQQALKEISKTEKLLKGQHGFEDIYWLRGRMAEEKLAFKEAIEWFKKSSNEKSPAALKERALWYLAWNQRKTKDYAEAAKTLEQLKNLCQDPFDKQKYSFWLARSYHQAEQKDAADKEYKWLIDNDPLGYYGLVAHREMGIPFPPMKESRSLASESNLNGNEILGAKNKMYLDWLIAVSEPDLAEKYLNSVSLNIKQKDKPNQDEWYLTLKYYAQAGRYLPLFAQLGNMENSTRQELLTKHPELLFPLPYENLILQASEKFSVRPELIYAIIRQESAFNPMARSPMDAFGLMQVLPEIAKQHAKKADVKILHYEDLYQPEVNIPVGASLLSQLLNQYKGQFVLAVAGYNANEKAINGWIKSRLGEDPLEFIEDIPYQETRAYVKLVMRNMIFYQRLRDPLASVSFPEWCLANLQTAKQ